MDAKLLTDSIEDEALSDSFLNLDTIEHQISVTYENTVILVTVAVIDKGKSSDEELLNNFTDDLLELIENI